MVLSLRAARKPLAVVASAALAASIAVGITSPAVGFTPDVKPTSTTIATGVSDTLVLNPDGRVYGSGDTYRYQLPGVPEGTGTIGTLTQLSALPGGVRATAVAGGAGATVALGADGKVYGSGENYSYQLTLAGASNQVNGWVEFSGLPPGTVVTDVAVSDANTLVRTSDGKVYGVGSNENSQLTGAGGAGVYVTTLTPLALPAGVTAAKIAGAGWYDGSVSPGVFRYYSLVLGSNGVLYGAGDNYYGQLGGGAAGNRSVLTPFSQQPAGQITAISAGGSTSYVVVGGKIWSYGSNAKGQRGCGACGSGSAPLVMTGGANAGIVAVDAGKQFVLALSSTTAYGAGDNNQYQLAQNNFNDQSTLVPLTPPTATPVEINAGRDTSVIRTRDGEVYGSGYNNYQQLTGTGVLNKQVLTLLTGQRMMAYGAPAGVIGPVGVGGLLTATNPTTSVTASANAYQWMRDGAPISGATAQPYTQTAADAGHTLAVTVTASRAGYASIASTSASTSVLPLYSVKAPRIKGTAKVGKKLKIGSKGSWAPAPASYSYQWLRNGKVIKKATKTSYKLTKKDKGKRISVRVTANKPGVPSASAISKRTGKVKK